MSVPDAEQHQQLLGRLGWHGPHSLPAHHSFAACTRTTLTQEPRVAPGVKPGEQHSSEGASGTRARGSNGQDGPAS